MSTTLVRYERAGRCFWHKDCEGQRHAPPMKVERNEETRSLLRCTACNIAAWYPVGSVGDVACEVAPAPVQAQPVGDAEVMRLTLLGQVHELIDIAERHAWTKDADERHRTEGAIAHARTVTAPYNYNGGSARQEPSPAPAPQAEVRKYDGSATEGGARYQADANLRALLRYTESFYVTAIKHGMKAGQTANAIAHIERAAKALHQLVHAWADTAECRVPAVEVKDAEAMLAECAPYLKDGETPAQCIKRNRADAAQMLSYYSDAKRWRWWRDEWRFHWSEATVTTNLPISRWSRSVDGFVPDISAEGLKRASAYEQLEAHIDAAMNKGDSHA